MLAESLTTSHGDRGPVCAASTASRSRCTWIWTPKTRQRPRKRNSRPHRSIFLAGAPLRRQPAQRPYSNNRPRRPNSKRLLIPPQAGRHPTRELCYSARSAYPPILQTVHRPIYRYGASHIHADMWKETPGLLPSCVKNMSTPANPEHGLGRPSTTVSTAATAGISSSAARRSNSSGTHTHALLAAGVTERAKKGPY